MNGARGTWDLPEGQVIVDAISELDLTDFSLDSGAQAGLHTFKLNDVDFIPELYKLQVLYHWTNGNIHQAQASSSASMFGSIKSISTVTSESNSILLESCPRLT